MMIKAQGSPCLQQQKGEFEFELTQVDQRKIFIQAILSNSNPVYYKWLL